jgi:NAD(P)-dependent dehydrogenase (short-subunit alcohol dehydrogenase family)
LRIRVNSIAPGWVLTEKQIARANAEDIYMELFTSALFETK